MLFPQIILKKELKRSRYHNFDSTVTFDFPRAEVADINRKFVEAGQQCGPFKSF